MQWWLRWKQTISEDLVANPLVYDPQRSQRSDTVSSPDNATGSARSFVLLAAGLWWWQFMTYNLAAEQEQLQSSCRAMDASSSRWPMAGELMKIINIERRRTVTSEQRICILIKYPKSHINHIRPGASRAFSSGLYLPAVGLMGLPASWSCSISASSCLALFPPFKFTKP